VAEPPCRNANAKINMQRKAALQECNNDKIDIYIYIYIYIY
jgi:hypothetical protein